jgi:alkane 1-monooxygenase
LVWSYFPAIIDSCFLTQIRDDAMKAYTRLLANGETVHYVDRKRWLWVLSVAYPLQALIPVWLHARTGNELWFILPFVTNYLVAPLLDWLIGEDTNNPPEEIVMQLEQDHYYRRLTYVVIPLHYITLVGCVAYATTQNLSWWAFAMLAIVAGMTAGLAINTGHELGHKNSKLEKTLAKVVLAVPAYGHFTLEISRQTSVAFHQHNPAVVYDQRCNCRISRNAVRLVGDSFSADSPCLRLLAIDQCELRRTLRVAA